MGPSGTTAVAAFTCAKAQVPDVSWVPSEWAGVAIFITIGIFLVLLAQKTKRRFLQWGGLSGVFLAMIFALLMSPPWTRWTSPKATPLNVPAEPLPNPRAPPKERDATSSPTPYCGIELKLDPSIGGNVAEPVFNLRGEFHALGDADLRTCKIGCTVRCCSIPDLKPIKVVPPGPMNHDKRHPFDFDIRLTDYMSEPPPVGYYRVEIWGETPQLQSDKKSAFFRYEFKLPLEGKPSVYLDLGKMLTAKRPGKSRWGKQLTVIDRGRVALKPVFKGMAEVDITVQFALTRHPSAGADDDPAIEVSLGGAQCVIIYRNRIAIKKRDESREDSETTVWPDGMNLEAGQDYTLHISRIIIDENDVFVSALVRSSSPDRQESFPHQRKFARERNDDGPWQLMLGFYYCVADFLSFQVSPRTPPMDSTNPNVRKDDNPLMPAAVAPTLFVTSPNQPAAVRRPVLNTSVE